MVEGGGGTSFPVLFYDGEREINIGSVGINPTLEYKQFQHMLSQKIGISPNQISIYLLERKRIPNTSFYEYRRKMTITGKVNFSSVCRMKDCYFLTVFKRSRKSRVRRDRSLMKCVDQDFHPHYPVGDNLVLLRRNQELPFYDNISTEELNDLNYEMGMATIGDLDMGLDPFPFLGASLRRTNMRMMMNNATEAKVWCEECLRENKERDTWSFHHCINDEVIKRFESRVGPIKRFV